MESRNAKGTATAQVGQRDTVLLERMRARPRRRAYACFPPRLVLFFCPRRPRACHPLLPQKPRGLANVHPRECRQIRIVDAMDAKAGTFRFRPSGRNDEERGMRKR